MLKGLSHVAIWVTDVERAIDFYTRIPGVSEHFRLYYEDGSLWLVYLMVGDRRQFVELFPRAMGPYQRLVNAGFSHLCLEVDDMQEMYRFLIERGLSPKNEPRLGADGTWQLWIDDPDGNPIEFQQLTPDSMQVRGERDLEGFDI